MDLTQYFANRGIELQELAPGLRVPRVFSDAAAEHMATRRSAALFDFSFMACLEIEGADALAMLHTVQTRQLADLAVGRLRYTLLLEDDGAVRNDATVWRTRENAYLLFTGRRTDIPFITAPAANCDVTVRDLSGSVSVLAVQGPQSRGCLAASLPDVAALPYFGFADSQWRGHPVRVARIGYSGELGYEIVCDSRDAAELWDHLRNAGATEAGFAAADSLRIEAGYVLFTNELSFRVSPLEIELERLVDGRNVEQSARRKRAQWRSCGSQLTGLVLDGPVERAPHTRAVPVPGWAVLTSACYSPLLERWIGLGFAMHEDRQPGTRIRVAENVRATVARLPFYDPMKRLPRS